MPNFRWTCSNRFVTKYAFYVTSFIQSDLTSCFFVMMKNLDIFMLCHWSHSPKSTLSSTIISTPFNPQRSGTPFFGSEGILNGSWSLSTQREVDRPVFLLLSETLPWTPSWKYSWFLMSRQELFTALDWGFLSKCLDLHKYLLYWFYYGDPSIGFYLDSAAASFVIHSRRTVFLLLSTSNALYICSDL